MTAVLSLRDFNQQRDRDVRIYSIFGAFKIVYASTLEYTTPWSIDSIISCLHWPRKIIQRPWQYQIIF